ncbi:DHH family phosphoesterase [Desulfuromonas thiophila]|uniref:Phosphoesterase RecJ domain-containing protein n=1 Tax=Desulfuromonas thiophila TaxID=57664 RepID=A0A1G7C2V7_9BACT|nr:bifunctional oligoribonuclease/PAP phosphatase NrnA [Desulfuromonas thiophila]SDE33629.1 phosphoesterase RecJ domain-containing protein [Desulfuromonas thiophila]
MNPLNEIAAAIRASQTVLIAAHEGPDGDAIGSTLALTLALREMGKQAVAFNCDGVPDKLAFLAGSDGLVCQLPAQQRFDLGFVLDAGELRRVRHDMRACCQVLVNIDHHPCSEDFGDHYWVDTQASATAVLIYRLLRSLNHSLSQPVAECLYTAILSDTGSFRYSSANPEAYTVAGELVAVGVDPWRVAGGLYESQEAQRLRLLALALATLRLSRCGRIAAISATTDMFAEAQARPEDADSFVNYPRSIRGVEVALFFRQTAEQCYKLSMRSKGLIDVGSLSRELGGGGHHNAAGAELTGTLPQVQEFVFSRLEPLLAQPDA